ncbi:hypothetical protein OROMI_027445 [Orobanche minor]
MTPKNIGYSFTRPSYAPPGTYPPPMSSSEIKEFDESYLSQTIEVSERALEHYNKKHHTNYELVEALRSNGILHGGIWFHCNFKAKDKSVSELPIKLFFAELKVVKALPSKFEVTACRILDVICHRGGTLVHPPNGFKEGLYYRNLHRILTLRTRPAKRSRNY